MLPNTYMYGQQQQKIILSFWPVLHYSISPLLLNGRCFSWESQLRFILLHPIWWTWQSRNRLCTWFPAQSPGSSAIILARGSENDTLILSRAYRLFHPQQQRPISYVDKLILFFVWLLTEKYTSVKIIIELNLFFSLIEFHFLSYI